MPGWGMHSCLPQPFSFKKFVGLDYSVYLSGSTKQRKMSIQQLSERATYYVKSNDIDELMTEIYGSENAMGRENVVVVFDWADLKLKPFWASESTSVFQDVPEGTTFVGICNLNEELVSDDISVEEWVFGIEDASNQFVAVPRATSGIPVVQVIP